MSNFMGKEEKTLIDLRMKQLNENDGNKKFLVKILELEKQLKQKDEEIKNLSNKFIELEKRIQNIESKGKIKFLLMSDIINNKNEIDFILKRLNLENKNFSLNLIYKCNKSNDNPRIFHENCDEKKNLLVFVETTENVKFGGFTLVGFNTKSLKTKDNDAFLFNMDKKKIYNVKKDKDAVYCLCNYGPSFCGTGNFNIYIGGNNILEEKCNTSEAKDNSYDIKEDYELNNSKQYFYVKNLEVFQLIID